MKNWILKIRFFDGAYEEVKEFKDFHSLSFGRNPDCSWSLSSPLLSRAHFKINYHEGKIFVEDLNSTNGTMVNGLPVPVDLPLEIKALDKISTGQAEFFFQIEDWVLTAPPEEPVVAEPVAEVAPEVFETREESTDLIKAQAPQAILPEQLLFEAQQKAAALIAKAHEEAEEKSRELFNKAQEERLGAQQESERITQKAQFDAQKTMQKAQDVSEKLLDEARQSANKIREQAQSDLNQKYLNFEGEMKKLRHKAEVEIEALRNSYKKDLEHHFEIEKNQVLAELNQKAKFELETQISLFHRQNESLRQEAEAYSRDLKEKADQLFSQTEQRTQSLQDQIKDLEMKEQDLIQGIQSLEQLQHSLKTKNEEWLEKIQGLEQIEKEKEASVSELTKDLKNREDYLKKIEKEFFHRNSQLQNDYDELLAKLTEQRKSQEKEHFEFLSKNEQIQSELQQKISRLKAELELGKKEHRDKTEHAIQQEKERLKYLLQEELKSFHEQRQNSYQQILNHVPTLTKELQLLLEQHFGPKLGLKEVSAHLPEISTQFQKILYQAAGSSGLDPEQEKLKTPPLKKRSSDSQRFWSGFAVSSFAFVILFFVGSQVNWSLNPVQRAQEEQTRLKQLDLASRKFAPPQDQALRESLSESVIYTKDFAELFANPDFKNRSLKAGAAYMLRTFQVPEESSVAAISALQTMIAALHEQKEKIHPDYIKQDLAKMTDVEKQYLNQIKNILGTEVRRDALIKYQRDLFLSARTQQ